MQVLNYHEAEPAAAATYSLLDTLMKPDSLESDSAQPLREDRLEGALSNHVRSMMDSFNALIGVLKEAEVQTGQPRVGRVAYGRTGPPVKEKVDSAPNLRTIVNRLRWGLPLMRYTQRDPAMRSIMLAELIQQNVD